MKYTIYQILDDEKGRDFRFEDYQFARKACNDNFLTILSNYDEVYNGEIDAKGKNKLEVLDELFEIFNINHPEDFRGHSLSVSDIVLLDDSDYYYCDSFGWAYMD